MSGLRDPITPTLDHVGITCADLDVSLDFYHRLLELPLLARGVGEGRAAGLIGARVAFARVGAGGRHMLELLQYLDDASGSSAVPVNRSGGVHVALGVPDLDAVLARLHERSVEPLTDTPVTVHAPDHGAWHGAKLVYVLDPDGHTVELVQFSAEADDATADCCAAAETR